MSEKVRILILGAGVMQGPALSIAKEMGLETVAVDADPNAPCVSLADRFEKVDLKDREGVAALGKALMDSGGLGGVMTAGTDFSATVAWAAEKLGLAGIPFETALDASDKERMRGRFKAAGAPSPGFVICTELPSKSGFVPPFPWPAVVKPVDNMGSRGCRRVDNPHELEAAVADALRFSRSGRAIVEEYMEGPEFSVDALVYRGEITICGLADRHIFYPPYFIEMGHTMPTNMPPQTVEALLAVFCRGVKALGIDNGAAKGDIKLTPKGPMIGEIAARLSGGYMSGWTYPYASGVRPTRGAIQIALGRKPDYLEPSKHWTCAERAFISIPGTVASIYGLDRAKAVEGVKDLFMRIREGNAVTFPENNVSKCGNVISAAPTRDEAVNSAEKAVRSILIRLKPGDKATADFLGATPSAETRFPPDAFTLDKRLLGLLEKLPEGTGAAANCAAIGTTGGAAALSIYPFPEFATSGLTDYVGRGVEESLEAVRTLTGLPLPLTTPAPSGGILGRFFWAAFIRGGYQGAAWLIETMRNP
jgi:biotin carboxylase